MNKHEKFVITINRQFGTGGHEVGAEIAKRLGVKLLDKQILQAVARKFDIGQETVEKLESRNQSWWDDFTQFYRSYIVDNEYQALGEELTSGELFEAQIIYQFINRDPIRCSGSFDFKQVRSEDFRRTR